MKAVAEGFSLDVEGIKGVCPAGEKWAEQNILNKKIPVLSCEGPCIRGDIARLAANLVAKEEPFARACYAETAFVPYSAMARWVKQADQIVMIDGCFLKCIGRIMNHLTNEEKIVHIDALSLYKKYTDVFYMEDVADAERNEAARQVADKILSSLKDSLTTGTARQVREAIHPNTNVVEGEKSLGNECGK